MSAAIDPAGASLIVIAKEPREGHAKTRLIPALGAAGAAAVARACLEDTLWAVAETPAAERVLVLDGEPGDWLPEAGGFRVLRQRDGDLGARLAGAFADSGAAPAVLVGMDTPQVNAGLLGEAIERLCAPGIDAVLGPAADGGYWAIGLRERRRSRLRRRADERRRHRRAAAHPARGPRPGVDRARAAPRRRHGRGRAGGRAGGTVDALRRDAAAAGARGADAEGGRVSIRRGLAALAVSGLLAAAGCGSSETNPPPAEPAASPPPAAAPAGTVTPLGRDPEGVVVDGRTGLAAVASRDPDTLSLIDVGTGDVVERVGLPGPARHLGLAGPGGPVLVPVEYEDRLLRVQLPGGRTESVRTGDFPHDAVEAANGRTFVGDEGGDTITVLEGERVIEALPAPEQPGGVAISGDVLAVVAVAAREVALYDTETLERIALLPGGAGPSHVVAGDDGRFYVTDTGGDAILVYDADPEEGEPRLVDRANLPGSPYGIAIDPGRERLWVTQTARNRVAELEITELAPKIIDGFPTVRQPNSVGVDPRTGRVVVVGRARGEVQIFAPDEER